MHAADKRFFAPLAIFRRIIGAVERRNNNIFNHEKIKDKERQISKYLRETQTFADLGFYPVYPVNLYLSFLRVLCGLW